MSHGFATKQPFFFELSKFHTKSEIQNQKFKNEVFFFLMFQSPKFGEQNINNHQISVIGSSKVVKNIKA
jgi:hypothetical protein